MSHYIRAWLVAGAVAVGAVVMLAPPGTQAVDHGPVAVVILLLATAAAESIELRLLHRNVLRAFTLLETAVVADLLLLPPASALLAVVAGVGISQLVRRREARKVAWNVAQFAVATALALGTYHGLADPAEPFTARSLVGLLVAMSVFGAVNTAAVTGLTVVIEGRPVLTVAREAGWLPLVNMFGNAAVGVLAVAIFELQPILLPFVAAPAVGLHLAYLGTVRSAELLNQVAAERDRLNQVVRGASDGIMLLDGDGIVEIWSPAMVELTGITPEEAVGRPADEIFDGHDGEGTPVDPLAPLRAAGGEVRDASLEMVLEHRSGGDRIVLARHTLLSDARGRVTADVVLLHDVTRQREVERLKDDFIARASHELRTPLTPIRGFAEVLLKRGDDVPEEMRAMSLQQISSHAERMTRLVDDLLLVSQAGEGASGPAPEREPTDLAAICKDVVGEVQADDPGRPVDIDVPERPVMALASAAWVGQVVSALVSNACKFSPSDTRIDVAVGADTGKGVWVRVTDRGSGIPRDQHERIFERFHRVEDPLTMTTRGLGLGLYLARQLARRMGGDVTVDSRLGEGSTFTLTLLAAAEHPAADRT